MTTGTARCEHRRYVNVCVSGALFGRRVNNMRRSRRKKHRNVDCFQVACRNSFTIGQEEAGHVYPRIFSRENPSARVTDIKCRRSSRDPTANSRSIVFSVALLVRETGSNIPESTTRLVNS